MFLNQLPDKCPFFWGTVPKDDGGCWESDPSTCPPDAVGGKGRSEAIFRMEFTVGFALKGAAGGGMGSGVEGGGVSEAQGE